MICARNISELKLPIIQTSTRLHRKSVSSRVLATQPILFAAHTKISQVYLRFLLETDLNMINEYAVL